MVVRKAGHFVAFRWAEACCRLGFAMLDRVPEDQIDVHAPVTEPLPSRFWNAWFEAGGFIIKLAYPRENLRFWWQYGPPPPSWSASSRWRLRGRTES